MMRTVHLLLAALLFTSTVALGAEPKCLHPRQVNAPYCSGVPPAPDYIPPRITVCDFCASSADCTAHPKGRCEMTASGSCYTGLKICRYPKDACARCQLL